MPVLRNAPVRLVPQAICRDLPHRLATLASFAVWYSALLSPHFTACGAENAKRPNVIVILSDDQGYGDVSAHGNPVLKTPNLDKLHGESIRLTDFHVAPMCTPTRGQLLTGLDCLRSGASSVCAGRSFIRRGTPTMPEIFRAAGYRTGHFGKWHLGDSYPNLPHQRGFEESVYHLGWGITSMADVWLNDCFDGRFARNGGPVEKFPGYCTDVWFDLAMNYMRDSSAKQEPFFVYLPTNAPHGPHWVAVMLRSRDEVLALKPDYVAMGDLEIGVVAPCRDGEGDGVHFEVRAFVPIMGVNEDPVTGSLNAGLAQWLIGEGLAPPVYVAAQGTAMGRAGRVHVERDGATVWIGGDVAPCISGHVWL